MHLKSDEVLMMAQTTEYKAMPTNFYTIWARAHDFLPHPFAGEAFGHCWSFRRMNHDFHSWWEHQSNIVHAQFVHAAVTQEGRSAISTRIHLHAFKQADYLGFAIVKMDPTIQINIEGRQHHPVWTVEELMTVDGEERHEVARAVMNSVMLNTRYVSLFLAADTTPNVSASGKEYITLARFYSQFGLKPAGNPSIEACNS